MWLPVEAIYWIPKLFQKYKSFTHQNMSFQGPDMKTLDHLGCYLQTPYHAYFEAGDWKPFLFGLFELSRGNNNLSRSKYFNDKLL